MFINLLSTEIYSQQHIESTRDTCISALSQQLSQTGFSIDRFFPEHVSPFFMNGSWPFIRFGVPFLMMQAMGITEITKRFDIGRGFQAIRILEPIDHSQAFLIMTKVQSENETPKPIAMQLPIAIAYLKPNKRIIVSPAFFFQESQLRVPDANKISGQLILAYQKFKNLSEKTVSDKEIPEISLLLLFGEKTKKNSGIHFEDLSPQGSSNGLDFATPTQDFFSLVYSNSHRFALPLFPSVYLFNNPYSEHLIASARPKLQYDKSVLVMGSGGGLDASFLAKTLNSRVDAVDISPLAVANTQAIAVLSEVGKKVFAWQSDVFDHVTKKYDFIIFNAPFPSNYESKYGSNKNTRDPGRQVLLKFLSGLSDRLNKEGSAFIMSDSHLPEFLPENIHYDVRYIYSQDNGDSHTQFYFYELFVTK